MSREFKQTFFTSLLVVLLIISNLIGLKLTNFLDLTISVDFLTYPFTFLCTLLIINLGGKTKAYQAVLVSALIQIFIVISYTLAVSLGNQTLIPDSANYVNELFKVQELNILASLVAFLSSHYVLIYIYDNFKRFGRELSGVVIGLLGSLFLNSTIYLVITLKGYDAMFVINMLLSNIIVSIIMLVIITILFYLLKEKDSKPVVIENMNINISKTKDIDLAIEDLMNSEINSKQVIKKEVKKKRNSDYSKNKKNNTKKNSSQKNSSKKTNNTKKNTISKSNGTKKTSQSKVNKTSK